MKDRIKAHVREDAGGFVAECEDMFVVTQGDSLEETVRPSEVKASR